MNGTHPRTVTDVRSFLGLTNHHRHFTNKYAKIPRPLNVLTVGQNTSKKKKEVEWMQECEEAFEKLKQLCSGTPILAYANYSKPFKLHAHANKLGLSVVLH